MSSIPKILHQTWMTTEVPAAFNALADTWKNNHPDWEYILWTDEMNRNFLKEFYPEFLDVYDNYPYPIQKVDAVRYFILFKMGGVFLDLDFHSLRNIGPILNGQTCVLAIEPKEHCKRFNFEKIVCNAFMASVPEHNFFRAVCNVIKRNCVFYDSNVPRWKQILDSTGPFMLTKVFDNFPENELIALLPANTVYPLTLTEGKILTETNKVTELIEMKIRHSYAVHYFLGTWR